METRNLPPTALNLFPTESRENILAARNSICQGEYSIWWDGFFDVLIHGLTSDPWDNPYEPDHREQEAHHQWQKGAHAAETSGIQIADAR